MLAERVIGADSARMGITRAIPRPYQPTCAPPPPTLPQSSAVRRRKPRRRTHTWPATPAALRWSSPLLAQQHSAHDLGQWQIRRRRLRVTDRPAMASLPSWSHGCRQAGSIALGARAGGAASRRTNSLRRTYYYHHPGPDLSPAGRPLRTAPALRSSPPVRCPACLGTIQFHFVLQNFSRFFVTSNF